MNFILSIIKFIKSKPIIKFKSSNVTTSRPKGSKSVFAPNPAEDGGTFYTSSDPLVGWEGCSLPEPLLIMPQSFKNPPMST